MNVAFEHGFPTRMIALADIVVHKRARALRTDGVAVLAESMGDRGLINPITLSPLAGGRYRLIAGHHRLAAADRLGLAEIQALILDGLDAVDAELCEIDENLIRVNLTDAERAGHHARRKELHQQRHPETRHGNTGRGRGKSRQNGETNDRYTKDTAKKTGDSERTIQRNVKRGNDIPNVTELAGTSLDQGDELDALAKLKDVAPDLQADLIERAKNGQHVSAKAEIEKIRRVAPEAEPGANIGGNIEILRQSAETDIDQGVDDDEIDQAAYEIACKRQQPVESASYEIDNALAGIKNFWRDLQECLNLEVWKCKRADDKDGSLIEPTSFYEFVHASRPEGLNIDYEILRGLIEAAKFFETKANIDSLCKLQDEVDRLIRTEAVDDAMAGERVAE